MLYFYNAELLEDDKENGGKRTTYTKSACVDIPQIMFKNDFEEIFREIEKDMKGELYISSAYLMPDIKKMRLKINAFNRV